MSSRLIAWFVAILSMLASGNAVPAQSSGIAQPPPVTLPARFDLVNTLSGTATNWIGVTPNKKYNVSVLGQPLSTRSYGWLSATGITGWDSDIDDFVMVSLGPSDDDFTEREQRLRDGHSFTTTKVFKVKVPATSPHVRVRVVVGRHDRSLHGIKVFRRNGTANAANLMTIEEHPWTMGSPGSFEDLYGDLSSSNDYGGTGAWTRTRVAKANLEPICTSGSDVFANNGGYRSFWFDVQASANDVAAITFTSDAQASLADIAVAAIEIYDASEAPLEFSFDGTAPALVRNTAYSLTTADEAYVDDALVDLNSGDLEGAIDNFTSVSDTIAKANGLLWSAGWLGDESAEGSLYGDPVGSADAIDDGQALFGSDGFEWELIEEAIDILTVSGTVEPSHSHAAEWLDRARQYQRALQHHRLRAYPSIPFPAGGDLLDNPIVIPDPPPTLCIDGTPGRLTVNNGIADALWRDIATQDVAQFIDHFIDTPANATAGVALNPLFFKASVYLALNRHGRSPINSAGDAESFSSRQEAYQPFKALKTWGLREPDGSNGFEGPFARNAILAIGQYMASDPAYDATSTSSLYQDWDGDGEDVVYGDPPNAPRWWDELAIGEALTSGSNAAPSLWGFQRRLRAAMGWWTTAGLGGGEFGGGGGDDVELLLQGISVTAPFPQSEQELESAMGVIVDNNLAEHESTGHFFGNGETAFAADTEHTGEFTGNPLFAALAMWPGEPYYTEYARQSFQRMFAPTEVNGVAGLTWTDLVEEIGPGALDIDLDQFGARHEDPTRSYANGVWSPPASSVDLDLRYFRSWRLDAEGAQITGPVGESPVGDTPLNGRVMLPAYRLLDQYRSPAIAQPMRQWAEFWWYVAMDHDNKLTTTSASPQDKPVGVLPPIVQFRRSIGGAPAGFVHGDPNATGTPKWFNGPSKAQFFNFYDYSSAVSESAYIYGLFRWRYRDHLTPQSDRVDYLLPIYLAGRYAAKWEWSGPMASEIAPDLNVALLGSGRDGWIAKRYVETPAFMWQLYLALPYLYDEADKIALRINSAPLSLGMETSESEVLDVLDWAVESLRANGPVYMQDLLASPQTYSAINTNLDEGASWFATFFPLVTESVLYTDKVFLAPQPSGTSNSDGKATANAYAALTGGPLSPAPSEFVRWRGREIAGEPAPMLMSILVNPFDDMSDVENLVWKADISHFQDNAGLSRVVEVELSPRFPEGQYDIELLDGTAVLWTDGVDLGPFGSTVSIPIPYSSNPWDGSNAYTLTVTRTGDLAPTAPAWSLEVIDVAVGRRDLDLVVDTGSYDFTLTYAIHNLGFTDILATTVITRVEVSDDDGATWDLAEFDATSAIVAVPSTFAPGAAPDLAARLAWLEPLTSAPQLLNVTLPTGWSATDYLVRASISVDALNDETRLGNNAAARTYHFSAGTLTEL